MSKCRATFVPSQTTRRAAAGASRWHESREEDLPDRQRGRRSRRSFRRDEVSDVMSARRATSAGASRVGGARRAVPSPTRARPPSQRSEHGLHHVHRACFTRRSTVAHEANWLVCPLVHQVDERVAERCGAPRDRTLERRTRKRRRLRSSRSTVAPCVTVFDGAATPLPGSGAV
jgi:hypothetical protein